MLLGTFAWSFVYVSLPFHIQRMSTLDAAATLRWTGWILGISPLITVITAPISGRIGERIDPKRGFMAVQAFQGLGFLGMALARTLPEMLVARVLLGLMGAVSTFAFIMVGRSGGDVRRQVSYIQSGMTLGQVLGPAVGAVVAARLGFRLSFILGGVMLWACSALVAWGVPPGKPRDAKAAGDRRTSPRELVTACLVVLTGSTQIFFLAAILPQILPPLGVSADSTLEVSGFLLLITGLAAALGAMAAPRLAEVVGDRRALIWFLLGLLAAGGRARGRGQRVELRGAPLPAGAVHRAGLPALGGGDRAAGVRGSHRIRQLGADRGGLHRAGRGDDAAVVHAARRRLPGAGRDGAVGDPARGAAQPPRASVGRGPAVGRGGRSA